MREPSLRTSRLAIAGGLAAAVVVGAAGFAIGRMTSPRITETNMEMRPVVATPSPAVVVTSEDIQPLDRGGIIALANRAADAASSGVAQPPDVEKGAGRRFNLTIPFGCSGPSEAGSSEPLRWSYDPQKQTLRISVSMTVWEMEDWSLPSTSQTNNVAEGFWISRPWSSSGHCPIAMNTEVSPATEAVSFAGQTLGLGQLSVTNSARNAEKQRSFETVQRVTAERFAAMKGFVIRIKGRLVNLAGGPPIHCVQTAGIEQRPRCLIAASFDEVRIEAVGEGDALATWSVARTPGDS